MSLILDIWKKLTEHMDIITICRCSNICQELYELLERYVAQIKYVNGIHCTQFIECGDLYHGYKSRIINTEVMRCMTPYKEYSCMVSIDNMPFSAAVMHYQRSADSLVKHILIIEDSYLDDDHISGQLVVWLPHHESIWY